MVVAVDEGELHNAQAVHVQHAYSRDLFLLSLMSCDAAQCAGPCSQVRGGEFGTGYQFGGSQLRAITYRNRVEGDPNKVVEGDGDGKPKPVMG
jgi:hypothetical protein